MPAPRFVPTDIRKITEDLVTVYEQSNPDLNFWVKSSLSTLEIEVDPDQYSRVLVNLFDNAVAAMDRGDSLTVTLEQRGMPGGRKEAVITIADTGRGISHRDMDRLFDPYFSRRSGGTGLGLAIVNSIVSDHNGTITVKMNRPKGTVFTIILPEKQP